MNPKLLFFLVLLCFNQPFCSVARFKFSGVGNIIKNVKKAVDAVNTFCDSIHIINPSYSCSLTPSPSIYYPHADNKDNNMPDISLYKLIFNFSVGGGASPQNMPLILDTTLDYTFMLCQCDDSCSTESQVYNPSISNTFSKYTCDSSDCPSLADYVSCSDGYCTYNYTYPSYVSSTGTLVTDMVDFSSDPFVFGCGETNEGNYGSSVGSLGLGATGLSLLNQINYGKFSYCISSSSDDGAFLLGSDAQLQTSTASSTGFLTNKLVPRLYYVNFTGVNIGGQSVDIPSNEYLPQPDGTGGMVLDTTSLFTYLEESAYNATRDEFANQMNSFTQVDPSQYGLDLCFAIPSGGQPTIPQLTLLLDGAEFSPQSDLYFQTVDSNDTVTVGCLLVFPLQGVSVFGTLMQLDTHMVYDVSNGMLQFESIDCSTLI